MDQKYIDVSEIVENQKLNPFWLRIIVISWLITFFDGFDMQALAFLVPYISDDMDVSRLMFGNIFTAGMLGTMVGGFVFGPLGDRIGRRPAILIASLGFSVFTAGLGLAETPLALLVLRFFGGIALGGMLPLCWALNVEYAPRRLRRCGQI